MNLRALLYDPSDNHAELAESVKGLGILVEAEREKHDEDNELVVRRRPSLLRSYRRQSFFYR